MNVDQEELQKFNSLANKWWDMNGACRFLHQLNPVRLQWIEKTVSPKGKKVLDIGCGGGILSEALAKRGAIVTGIDLAEDAIHTAKMHARQSGLNIDYHLASAEDFARENPNTYDIIVCMELLEHVPDPAPVISAVSQMIKPDGAAFFSTLNRNFKSFFYAIAGAEYILGLLPKGTHQFQRFITPAELSRHIRKADMEVTAITGIQSNLQATRFFLSDDVSINYMLACQYSFQTKKR